MRGDGRVTSPELRVSGREVVRGPDPARQLQAAEQIAAGRVTFSAEVPSGVRACGDRCCIAAPRCHGAVTGVTVPPQSWRSAGSAAVRPGERRVTKSRPRARASVCVRACAWHERTPVGWGRLGGGATKRRGRVGSQLTHVFFAGSQNTCLAPALSPSAMRGDIGRARARALLQLLRSNSGQLPSQNLLSCLHGGLPNQTILVGDRPHQLRPHQSRIAAQRLGNCASR